MKHSEINKYMFFYMLHTRIKNIYDIVQSTTEYELYQLTTPNDYHKGGAKIHFFKHLDH